MQEWNSQLTSRLSVLSVGISLDIYIVYLLSVDNGWKYKDMNIAACPRLVATDCEAAQLYHEMISSLHRVSS